MMKPTQRAAMLSGALCALSLHAAEPTTVEERLKKLEGQVELLSKENTDLKKQLGWDGKSDIPLVKPGGKEQKIKLGGYLQGNAEFGGAPDSRYNGVMDRFLLRRARINVSGSFMENFDFKAEVDIGNNSLGATTGAAWKPTASDIFINWNKYDFANIKIGQFKTPFGYEQLVADTKTWFAERSLPNDRLTDSRQIGMAVSGDVLEKRLAYSVAAFNGNSINNGGNDNDNFEYVARVSGTPWSGKLFKQDSKLSLGVNGLYDNSQGIAKAGFTSLASPFSGERTGFGTDLQFALGPFELQAEYIYNGYRNIIAPLRGETQEAQGFYVAGSYMIVPKKLRGLVRFETFDPNIHRTGDSTDVWTLGLTYFVKGDDLKLDVNYLYGNAADVKGDNGRLITRVQVIF